MRKLIVATAVAFLTASILPAIAANKPIPKDLKRSPGQAAIGCGILTLMDLSLGAVCFKTQVRGKSSRSRMPAKVTIHKPEGGKCANGNTYRIMRVSDVRSVCRNSFKQGSAAPACTNIAGRNGNAHSIIIVDKRGSHLAHEIRHACDRDWNH